VVSHASQSRAGAVPLAGRLRAYLELGKLRLSALAVIAVIAGVHLGSDGPPQWPLLIWTTVGTFAVAAGGNALNMLLERDADRAMLRTAGRPLPSGRLRPVEVAVFGLVAIAVGLAMLALQARLIAAALCALIAATYVLVYTPLKRVTTLNTLVGAIPGALPPVVGYVAAAGVVDTTAALLFLILFFWQIPHFLAIAWRHRQDYARGGMRMLPVFDADGRRTSVQMVVYTCALIVASLSAYLVGISGMLYLIAALFLDSLFLTAVVAAAVLRRDSAMRQCFLVSIIYLPLLLSVMVVDRPYG
jgi:protoheme IX farnesyltransferase